MKLIKVEDKSAGNQAHSAYSSFGCKTFTGKFRWQLRDTGSGSIVTGYMMMVVLNLIFFLPVTANCCSLLRFVGRCYYLSSGSTMCAIFLEGRYLIFLGLTKSVHPSTVVMLTVPIMCNAVVRAKIAYIWTISFLDCCSSLRFSCTWSLNWPWSERTPSKLDLGVACRGLEGCFWVLNRGAHGPVILWGDSSGAFSRIIVRLARILMFPGPLLWILLLAPYTSRLLNVVLVRVECSLRRRDVSF